MQLPAFVSRATRRAITRTSAASARREAHVAIAGDVCATALCGPSSAGRAGTLVTEKTPRWAVGVARYPRVVLLPFVS